MAKYEIRDEYGRRMGEIHEQYETEKAVGAAAGGVLAIAIGLGIWILTRGGSRGLLGLTLIVLALVIDVKLYHDNLNAFGAIVFWGLFLGGIGVWISGIVRGRADR